MNPVAGKSMLMIGAVIAILLISAGAGWHFRGLKCAADMADYKQDLSTKADAQRAESQAIEAKQEAATSQSTERLDQKQAESQKEIVYVDKQVIQYRDRWRDRTCQRPADWVRIYNSSLFGSGHPVPEASAARSAPAGAGL